MKKLFVVLSLVLAACGAGDDATFDPAAGFTQGSEGQARVLSYAYQADTSLTYGFTMDMSMDMSMDMDGVDDFGEMTMAMDMAGMIGYDIGAGPEPGTVEMTVSGALSEFSFSDLTVDGETMPPELMGDSGDIGIDEFIPEMTAVVDATGNIISLSYGDVAVPTEVLDSFGSGFSDPTGMGLQNAIFGPELPIDEVRIGATWTTDDTQEVPGFGEISATTRHEIVGEESKAGRETIVIESVTKMDPIEVSFADLMEMMTDPAVLSASGMTQAEIDEATFGADMMESLGMSFSMAIDYGDVVATTWLDYEAGLAVATDAAIEASIKMTIETPEGDGDMDMTMTMNMFTILTDDGATV